MLEANNYLDDLTRLGRTMGFTWAHHQGRPRDGFGNLWIVTVDFKNGRKFSVCDKYLTMAVCEAYDVAIQLDV